MRTCSAILLLALAFAAQADTLILKDGTRITGRWWSIDATHVHFLVNNQLQHYPRADASAVTFGDAALPTPPAPAPTAPAAPAQTPTAPAAPSRPPSLARPSDRSPAAAATHVSQPDAIAAVYFYNGKDLTPLERTQAAERRRGSTSYWEMTGGQSPVRVQEAPELVFILRLPKGVPPASYILFPLSVANGKRQTQTQAGRRGGLATWPFQIEVNDDSGYMTYALRVKDLPTGEYSFSPSNSNDGYCFGVDSGGQ